MFGDCKREIQRLRNKNNELHTENREIHKIIEYFHEQTTYLKKRINEHQSAFIPLRDADLKERVKKLEYCTRKKISA